MSIETLERWDNPGVLF
ncbi:Protein of unknown function [Bacillus mycoides]|uniref:Uncharacterized protein n=1 Tax=Bacillus mycoides TaxID=1405 RepID=A0A1G4ELN8_BACMY|nr:Protein of unknown function [Bacillus mycoides]